MLNLYIIAAIIGAGLVVVSAFAHHDHDASFDADHDVDVAGAHEHDHATDTWLPFFSLRFWTYFAAAFGLIGILLTLLRASQEPTTAIYASAGGFVTGMTVFLLMRALKNYQTDSSLKEDDLLGQEAKVVVSIRPPSAGKVRAHVKGETIEILALPQEGDAVMEAGSDVIIVAMERERALVVPRAVLFE